MTMLSRLLNGRPQGPATTDDWTLTFCPSEGLHFLTMRQALAAANRAEARATIKAMLEVASRHDQSPRNDKKTPLQNLNSALGNIWEDRNISGRDKEEIFGAVLEVANNSDRSLRGRVRSAAEAFSCLSVPNMPYGDEIVAALREKLSKTVELAEPGRLGPLVYLALNVVADPTAENFLEETAISGRVFITTFSKSEVSEYRLVDTVLISADHLRRKN